MLAPLRYLPTNEQLVPIKRASPERWKLYQLAARILERQGLYATTCPIWNVYEAVAEAKQRVGPPPLIS